MATSDPYAGFEILGDAPSQATQNAPATTSAPASASPPAAALPLALPTHSGLSGGMGRPGDPKGRYDDFGNLKPEAQPTAQARPIPAQVQADPYAGFEILDNPSNSASPTILPKAAPNADPYAGFDVESRDESPTTTKSRSTPDADTWWGRRIQDIEGKRDPAYANTGSVFAQFPQLHHAAGLGALLGASDDQMADIVRKQLGPSFVREETDANGYPVIVTRDANGQEQKGYVNRPGLDFSDVTRAAVGAVPYIVGGGLTTGVAKKFLLNLPTRMLLQSLGAGATSVAGDKLQQPLGSDQGVEQGKAIATAILAGLGEPVAQWGSQLWQRFVTEPKYFNRATGELTDLGKQAAQKFGLDPNQMSQQIKQEFAKTYAANPNDAAKMLDRVSDTEFNIPSTIGQRTKDPQQLMLEKGLRYGTQGMDAKTIMQSLDDQQRQAVETAVRQTVPGTIQGAPLQGPMELGVGDFGQRIGTNLSAARQAAKAEARAAWDQTGAIVPKVTQTQVQTPMSAMTGVNQTANTMEAMPLLRDALSDNLRPYAGVISPENTPTAYRMWSYLNGFMNGDKPNTALHNALGLSGANDIDSVRKAVGLMTKDAQTPTDRMASGAIYDAYKDWMERAADQGLLTGDLQAVTQLRNARDISREMNAVFKPQQQGVLTPGGKLLQSIQANADTPERVVSSLFSGPKSDIRPGAIEALQRMKTGFNRYLPPDAANRAWNDIRLAYWSRLTQNPQGDLLGYQAMKQNLKAALNQQGSLVEKLFTPQEKAQIQRFITQLDKITYKDPNPSGTATGLMVFARQFAGKILDAIPFARVALESTGIPEHYAASVAKKAVAQSPLPRSVPAGGLLVPAVGRSYNPNDRQ